MALVPSQESELASTSWLKSSRVLRPTELGRQQVHWGGAALQKVLLNAGHSHVVADHLQRRVSQNLLKSKGVADLLDQVVGGEGVAEAVRVDLGDGGLFAEALEDGAHGGTAEGSAAAGEEEGAWLRVSEVF